MKQVNNTEAIENITIDHKILALHFKVTNEAMRQLKRKWEKEQKGYWLVYVKAYNYDMAIK